ncbi:helix-turn-helix domain-containing protein [Nocardia sp. NBC_01499]|uniref:helix-turn-helix domain-containing protein n=1 Tax=Nocardia sp. NBC_01499 TaxID=2903597 RepID=UPI00386F72D6
MGSAICCADRGICRQCVRLRRGCCRKRPRCCATIEICWYRPISNDNRPPRNSSTNSKTRRSRARWRRYCARADSRSRTPIELSAPRRSLIDRPRRSRHCESCCPTSELRATLAAFLDRNGSWTKAAEALYLHVNTVHYRIERIENLLAVTFPPSPIGWIYARRCSPSRAPRSAISS